MVCNALLICKDDTDAFQITMEWMAALQVAVPVCRGTGASGAPGQLPQISCLLKVIQAMFSTLNVSTFSVTCLQTVNEMPFKRYKPFSLLPSLTLVAKTCLSKICQNLSLCVTIWQLLGPDLELIGTG